MPGEIVRIPGLNINIGANDQSITFRFFGEADVVRLAVRDIVFGLDIMSGIESSIQFVSDEDINARAEASQFWQDSIQIDITIATKEFDRLVLMYRYLVNIGVTIFDSCDRIVEQCQDIVMHRYFAVNSQDVAIAALSEYLRQAKVLAQENNTSMDIPEYPRPECCLLWSQEELKAERAKIAFDTRSPAFFANTSATRSRSSRDVHQDLQLIKFIKRKIEFMIRKHPEMLHARKIPIDSYMDSILEAIKEARNKNEDPFDLGLAKVRYSLIHREDLAEFLTLIRAYDEPTIMLAAEPPPECLIL